MANSSVNHLLDLINQQITHQENLNDCLSKANALAELSLSKDFFEFSNEIKLNYFWALSDIIDKAKEINEYSLNSLLNQKNSQ